MPNRVTKRPVIKRKRNENDVVFLERAADIAKAAHGSIDAGYGAICPQCAPFGSVIGNAVELLPYIECYNCHAAEGRPDVAKN